MSRRSLVRQTEGTPDRTPDENEFVCGFCHNTGFAKNKKGHFRECHCGSDVVTTLEELRTE